MSKVLLKELKKLTDEETLIRKSLERKYFDANKRKQLFNRLKEIKSDASKIRFKLKMERIIVNENNNTN